MGLGCRVLCWGLGCRCLGVMDLGFRGSGPGFGGSMLSGIHENAP